MENYDVLVNCITTFCTYFQDKMIKESFNGYSIRGFNSTSSIKDQVEQITTMLKKPLSIENFVECNLMLFDNLSNFDFIDREFHLLSECKAVFNVLSTLLRNGFNVNGVCLELAQKNKLRIIHSQLSLVYNSEVFNQMNNRIDERVVRTINQSTNNGILKKHSKESFLAKENIHLIKLKRLMEKQGRYRQHVDVMRFHLQSKTTPKSLFFNRFPEPFIKNDEKFIEEYNTIIETCQTNIIKLIMSHFNDGIPKLEKEISDYIETFKEVEELKDVDHDLLYKECKSIVEGPFSTLTKFIKRSNWKAEQCKSRPFTVDQFKNYYKQSESFF